MSHIAVKKLLFPGTVYAGQNWFFDFIEIPATFEEKNVANFVLKRQQGIKPITQTWTAELNTEWLARHYMALKMLFSASLMLNSAQYALEKNIKVTDGYLQYYAIFSCLRAILLTDLRTPVNNGEIFKSTHSKTINISTSIVSSLSKDIGAKIKKYVYDLKDIREIFSYGAPSSGTKLYENVIPISIDDTIVFCKLLAEIAQLQSEILEKSLDKNFNGSYELKEDYIDKCVEYEINGIQIIDEEDAYRMGYFFRKWPRPTNILCMVSEGHVEDYFGAWVSEHEDQEDVFDPDTDWRIIFPFP